MNLYDEEIFLTFYAMSLGERIGAALDGKKLVFCHVDLFGRFWFSGSFLVFCVFLSVTTL